jgi:hypothetical protein
MISLMLRQLLDCLFYWSRQGWGIVNDLSIAHDLDAILVPLPFLIPDVEAGAIDILADDGNRLPHYIIDFLGVQARDLEVLHSIVLCELFEI